MRLPNKGEVKGRRNCTFMQAQISCSRPNSEIMVKIGGYLGSR